MKGIILHGGHGTRLRPLTHTGPKQLLPIANKPMSEYCIESMKDAGVKEILKEFFICIYLLSHQILWFKH